MDSESIVQKLLFIITEIDARYNRTTALSSMSLEQLCDAGIALFNKLKGLNNKSAEK